MATKRRFSWGTFIGGMATMMGIGATTSIALWKLAGWSFRPEGVTTSGELEADIPTPTPDDPLEGQGEPATASFDDAPTAVNIDQPAGTEFYQRESPNAPGTFTAMLRPAVVKGPGEAVAAWQWFVWAPNTKLLSEATAINKGAVAGINSQMQARAAANQTIDNFAGSTGASLAT